MGILDFFNSKSPLEKLEAKFNRLRQKNIVKEGKNPMPSFFGDEWVNKFQSDEDPNGIGEFGLTETNPIPVNGIGSIHAYVDKLRYEYTSKQETSELAALLKELNATAKKKYEHELKKKKYFPVFTHGKGATRHVDNIRGSVSVYDLYDINEKIKATIYLNCWCLRTSNKVPKGFVHRDDTPPVSDMKLWIFG